MAIRRDNKTFSGAQFRRGQGRHYGVCVVQAHDIPVQAPIPGERAAESRVSAKAPETFCSVASGSKIAEGLCASGEGCRGRLRSVEGAVAAALECCTLDDPLGPGPQPSP